MILLALLILTFPTDFELYRERKGEDPKKKGQSMTVRAFLMIVCALIAAWIRGLTWLMYLKCLLLSFAIFLLFFDYVFNIIFHRKTRVWYSYLSESPLDKAWSGWNWKVRMLIRGVVFGFALWFFLLSKHLK